MITDLCGNHHVPPVLSGFGLDGAHDFDDGPTAGFELAGRVLVAARVAWLVQGWRETAASPALRGGPARTRRPLTRILLARGGEMKGRREQNKARIMVFP